MVLPVVGVVDSVRAKQMMNAMQAKPSREELLLALRRKNDDLEREVTERHLTEEALRLYMVSDGVFDQVGGERKRGFGKKRFRELLLSLAEAPFERHGQAMLEALDAFQGEEARRDDVSIMGLEYRRGGPASSGGPGACPTRLRPGADAHTMRSLEEECSPRPCRISGINSRTRASSFATADT